MRGQAQKMAAFSEAVNETYDQDGLLPTLTGICLFLPTVVVEYIAGIASFTH